MVQIENPRCEESKFRTAVRLGVKFIRIHVGLQPTSDTGEGSLGPEIGRHDFPFQIDSYSAHSPLLIRQLFSVPYTPRSRVTQ